MIRNPVNTIDAISDYYNTAKTIKSRAVKLTPDTLMDHEEVASNAFHESMIKKPAILRYRASIRATLFAISASRGEFIPMEGEYCNMEFSDIEKRLIESQGLAGLKNQMKTKIVRFYFKKLKTKFGIEMTLRSLHKIDIVTDWIKRRDKNFNKHIMNPYVMDIKNRNNLDSRPITDCDFALQVAKATYIFYQWPN